MLRFHVEKMSCGHCVTAISNAVRSADVDANVDVDLSHKTVTVGSKLGAAELASAIAEAGYDAQLIQPAG